MEATAETTSVVKLTESAIQQVRSLLSAAENAGKCLRIYVDGGGCSGFQYGMVFDEKRAEDLSEECDGISVTVDPVSASHLRGSVVDYVDSLTGGGFKVSNPNARHSCGCGKSFEA